MTVPDPVVSIRALADSHPWARDTDHLIEVLRQGCSSIAGPLMTRASVRGAKGIEVERPCESCWKVRVNWHTFCREHGYPRGHRLGEPDLAGYPPAPTSRLDCQECGEVVFSWRQVRELFEADRFGEQLDLLSGAIS